MVVNKLTDVEKLLFNRIPGPPLEAFIKPTNIWIIEWLPTSDKRTGKLLHEWLQKQRPGWSIYCDCDRKSDVMSSIERATILSKNSEMIPVLHIEAHGNETGIGKSDSNGDVELIEWEEITPYFQQLNLPTKCNLVIVVAACIGFSGIKALVQGPRAPAIALVGPNDSITIEDLFSATIEFYKRWMERNPNLREIVASASKKAGTVSFEWEPYAVLAFDAVAEHLIISSRREEKFKQMNRIRQKLTNETMLSVSEIESRLSQFSQSNQADLVQHLWDKMFMIDLYPDNIEKFGVNWSEIVNMVHLNR